jgi:deoxycytidine triphosphate deaminase
MLNRQEIAHLVASHGLIRSYDANRLEAASYDMVIGTIFRHEQILNVSHPKAKDPVVLEPGEVVTMLTLEELNLPPDICGTAYAMNAQSSEGLLVMNPGHVDPGYQGPLTVVAVNLRKVPLALQLEDRIFTIVFSRLAAASSHPYKNKFGSRDEFERAVNKKVVEKSIGSLKHLLSMSEADIRGLIRDHWTTRFVFGISVLGTIAAVIAAVYAYLAVLPSKEVPSQSAVSKPRDALEPQSPSSSARARPAGSSPR